MTLKEAMYNRKSFRKYKNEVVNIDLLDKINSFKSSLKPLIEDIKTDFRIVNKNEIKGIYKVKSPHYIAIYSEIKDNYLLNVGFIYEQLDIYIQSLGLGSCWFGLGKIKTNDVIVSDGVSLNFVIMIAFGYPQKDENRSLKRKNLEEISDIVDKSLEPARIAPSSMNSQPWLYTHIGGKKQLYCIIQTGIKRKLLASLNKIDCGISLAHLYIEKPYNLIYYNEEKTIDLPGYYYIGSFKN